MATRAVQQGAFQCLVKPVDSAALNRTADRAVRLHRRAHRRRGVLAAFRNRRGEQVEIPSFTATDAKNEFGRVLETAIQKGVVAITRHDAPKAVLLSLDEFNALVGAASSKLDTLSGEFDALLARMQGPKARAGMKAAFAASPAQLGKAAVAAARKRG
ncbi:MAG TPA: prevent-host-death family protein [Candidatus Rokubacteria bacterium]|nr:prevent-host-death family protein [Candidatus Rokubacteria bacterium]